MRRSSAFCCIVFKLSAYDFRPLNNNKQYTLFVESKPISIVIYTINKMTTIDHLPPKLVKTSTQFR